MDPVDWPTWLKLLAGWGPLGVWAATAQISANKKDKAYHATRDAHEAALKQQATAHSAELINVTEHHAQTLHKQTVDFTARIEAMQDQHREEVKEMADRFISLTTTYAERSHALIDKVAALTDAIRRGGVGG